MSKQGRVLVLVEASGSGGRGRNFPSPVLILFAIPVRLAVRVAMVHVLAVRARVGEPLQALATLEGLLAAVQALVLRQVVLVLERLRTLEAFVGTLACQGEENNVVLFFVYFQVNQGCRTNF